MSEDESQNNGLCTSTWGSPGWFFLHSVAAGYPINPDEYDKSVSNPTGHTRRAYTNFFMYTGDVLPCRFCRDSYKIFVSETPIEDYIHSRESLFEWLFIIHNKVNEKLGVKRETDLQAIVRKYESFRARCPKSESANGCTIPAGNYTKMKCSVVIEPFEKCRTLPIAILTTLLTIAIVVLISKTRK